MALKFDVDLKGPIFTNAEGKVRDGIGDVLQAAIEAGEQHLDEMLRPRPAGVYLAVVGPKASKGNYRRNVHGQLLSNQHALITDGGVVYGPWLEGVGSRNEVTRFKGYSSFRKTRDWLGGKIHDIAAHINLAKRLGG